MTLSTKRSDHSGLLPRLCALGFRGPIYTTGATVDLLSVMLLDSAFIQESEWSRAQRRRDRGHGGSGATPPLLYTVAQAEACLEQLRAVAYDEELQPHDAVRCRFRDAGHILGSAIIEVWISETGKGGGDARTRKLVFSGDLGQPGRPVVRDPTPIASADVLLVESTYGNRLHRPLQETVDELVQVIDDTLRRRQGNIIIPAFALGRTQEVLHLLLDLCRQGRLPRLQVFVDSPMADKVTEITWKRGEFMDEEARALLSLRRSHPEWLDLRFTRSVDESMALNRIKAGAIIISASGMCDAGRIRHHLRHHLGRPECAVLIIGFQAEGTLGRRLVDGDKHVPHPRRRHHRAGADPHHRRTVGACRPGRAARLAGRLRIGAGAHLRRPRRSRDGVRARRPGTRPARLERRGAGAGNAGRPVSGAARTRRSR